MFSAAAWGATPASDGTARARVAAGVAEMISEEKQVDEGEDQVRAAAAAAAAAGAAGEAANMDARRLRARELAQLSSRGEADHYSVLGVGRTATAAEIKDAFREQARFVHPDKIRSLNLNIDDDAANALFRRLREASDVLTDTARREEYDRELAEAAAEDSSSTAAPAADASMRLTGEDPPSVALRATIDELTRNPVTQPVANPAQRDAFRVVLQPTVEDLRSRLREMESRGVLPSLASAAGRARSTATHGQDTSEDTTAAEAAKAFEQYMSETAAGMLQDVQTFSDLLLPPQLESATSGTANGTQQGGNAVAVESVQTPVPTPEMVLARAPLLGPNRRIAGDAAANRLGTAFAEFVRADPSQAHPLASASRRMPPENQASDDQLAECVNALVQEGVLRVASTPTLSYTVVNPHVSGADAASQTRARAYPPPPAAFSANLTRELDSVVRGEGFPESARHVQETAADAAASEVPGQRENDVCLPDTPISVARVTEISTSLVRHGPPGRPHEPLPLWDVSAEAKRCGGCNARFWFGNRKHHCRRCGGVFCGKCTAHAIPLPQYGVASRRARVCAPCADNSRMERAQALFDYALEPTSLPGVSIIALRLVHDVFGLPDQAWSTAAERVENAGEAFHPATKYRVQSLLNSFRGLSMQEWKQFARQQPTRTGVLSAIRDAQAATPGHHREDNRATADMCLDIAWTYADSDADAVALLATGVPTSCGSDWWIAACREMLHRGRIRLAFDVLHGLCTDAIGAGVRGQSFVRQLRDALGRATVRDVRALTQLNVLSALTSSAAALSPATWVQLASSVDSSLWQSTLSPALERLISAISASAESTALEAQLDWGQLAVHASTNGAAASFALFAMRRSGETRTEPWIDLAESLLLMPTPDAPAVARACFNAATRMCAAEQGPDWESLTRTLFRDGREVAALMCVCAMHEWDSRAASSWLDSVGAPPLAMWLRSAVQRDFDAVQHWLHTASKVREAQTSPLEQAGVLCAAAHAMAARDRGSVSASLVWQIAQRFIECGYQRWAMRLLVLLLSDTSAHSASGRRQRSTPIVSGSLRRQDRAVALLKVAQCLETCGGSGGTSPRTTADAESRNQLMHGAFSAAHCALAVMEGGAEAARLTRTAHDGQLKWRTALDKSQQANDEQLVAPIIASLYMRSPAVFATTMEGCFMSDDYTELAAFARWNRRRLGNRFNECDNFDRAAALLAVGLLGVMRGDASGGVSVLMDALHTLPADPFVALVSRVMADPWTRASALHADLDMLSSLRSVSDFAELAQIAEDGRPLPVAESTDDVFRYEEHFRMGPELRAVRMSERRIANTLRNTDSRQPDVTVGATGADHTATFEAAMTYYDLMLVAPSPNTASVFLLHTARYLLAAAVNVTRQDVEAMAAAQDQQEAGFVSWTMSMLGARDSAAALLRNRKAALVSAAEQIAVTAFLRSHTLAPATQARICYAVAAVLARAQLLQEQQGRAVDQAQVEILGACVAKALRLSAVLPRVRIPIARGLDEFLTGVLLRDLSKGVVNLLESEVTDVILLPIAALAYTRFTGVFHRWMSPPAEFVAEEAVEPVIDSQELVVPGSDTQRRGNGTSNGEDESEAPEAVAQRLAEDVARFVAMRDLLRSERFSFDQVSNLVDCERVPRTPEGFLAPVCPSHSSSTRLQFKSFDGFRFNKSTGVIEYSLTPARAGDVALFGWSDILEIVGGGIVTASFTLDAVDGEAPLHPFQQMRFGPNSMADTGLLASCMHADYLLKFLATGVEVSAYPPFPTRPIDAEGGLLSHLPPSFVRELQAVIRDMHANTAGSVRSVLDGGQCHRFWVQAGDLAMQQSENEAGLTVSFGAQKMGVKKHLMRRDPRTGELHDDDADQDGTPEGALAQLLTRRYAELARAFPTFARLGELSKICQAVQVLASIKEQVRTNYESLVSANTRTKAVGEMQSSLSEKWPGALIQLQVTRTPRFPLSSDSSILSAMVEESIDRNNVPYAYRAEARRQLETHARTQLRQLDTVFSSACEQFCVDGLRCIDVQSAAWQFLQFGDASALATLLVDRQLSNAASTMRSRLDTMNGGVEIPSISEISRAVRAGLQNKPSTRFVCNWVPTAFNGRIGTGRRVIGGVSLNPNVRNAVVNPPPTSTFHLGTAALSAQRGNAIPNSNAQRLDNLRAFNSASFWARHSAPPAASAGGAGGRGGGGGGGGGGGPPTRPRPVPRPLEAALVEVVVVVQEGDVFSPIGWDRRTVASDSLDRRLPTTAGLSTPAHLQECAKSSSRHR